MRRKEGAFQSAGVANLGHLKIQKKGGTNGVLIVPGGQ